MSSHAERMGLKRPFAVLRLWWEKVPVPVRTAFVTAVIVGLFTHMYAITHLMPNHDGAGASLAHDIDMLAQGRWFQRIAMLATTSYNMPWVNGCASILMLALASALTVSAAGFTTRMGAALTAALMVTHPTIAASLGYMYMADAFMDALALAALAVYLSRKWRFGFLPAAACLCLSMGIYQAYVCFAVALFVALLILDALREDIKTGTVWLRAVKDLAALALGIALYFGVLTLLLAVSHTQLTDYQGIDRIGLPAFGDLYGLVADAARGFVRYYTEDMPAMLGWLAAAVLWAALALSLAAAAAIAVKNRLWRQPLKALLLILLLAAAPAAMCSAYLMGADEVHMLMVYSMTAPLVLFVRLSEMLGARVRAHRRSLVAWGTVILSGVIVIAGFLFDNRAYFMLEAKFNQTYAYANRVVERVESDPDYYEGIPVAFVGYSASAPVTDTPLTGYCFGTHYVVFAPYNYYSFFRDFAGVDFQPVDYDLIGQIAQSEWFAGMPVYPQAGCIALTNDMLVVKLGEEATE